MRWLEWIPSSTVILDKERSQKRSAKSAASGSLSGPEREEFDQTRFLSFAGGLPRDQRVPSAFLLRQSLRGDCKVRMADEESQTTHAGGIGAGGAGMEGVVTTAESGGM